MAFRIVLLLLASASATARLDLQPLPSASRLPSRSPRWLSLSLRGGDASGLRSPAEAVAAAVEALDPAKAAAKSEDVFKVARSEESLSQSRKAATSLTGGAGEALAGTSVESPAKVGTITHTHHTV